MSIATPAPRPRTDYFEHDILSAMITGLTPADLEVYGTRSEIETTPEDPMRAHFEDVEHPAFL
jgi:hypothetical protein